MSQPALRSRNLANQSLQARPKAAIDVKSSAPQSTAQTAIVTKFSNGYVTSRRRGSVNPRSDPQCAPRRNEAWHGPSRKRDDPRSPCHKTTRRIAIAQSCHAERPEPYSSTYKKNVRRTIHAVKEYTRTIDPFAGSAVGRTKLSYAGPSSPNVRP